MVKQIVILAVVKQPLKEKENTEFKLAVPRWKMCIVLHLDCGGGVGYTPQYNCYSMHLKFNFGYNV